MNIIIFKICFFLIFNLIILCIKMYFKEIIKRICLKNISYNDIYNNFSIVILKELEIF